MDYRPGHIHPAVKEAIIGLSPKALLLIFFFFSIPRGARYAASELIPLLVKGHVPVLPECASAAVPQQAAYMAGEAFPASGMTEQAEFSRLAPLWCNLAVGFCQALSADKRSPEGLGAWENPTGGLHSQKASRGNPHFAGDKLQVQIFPKDLFDCAGYLSIHPALQPSESERIVNANSGSSIGYF
jgi:hypothetical protein